MPTAKPRPVPTPVPAPVAADFFRCLVANMRSGVLAIDRAGQVVLINEEARRLFRLPDDDYSGRRVERVLGDVPAEDRRKLLYENAIRLYHIDAVVAATKTAPDELPCS